MIWLYDLHVAPNGVNCKVNCSNRLELEILIEMTGCGFTRAQRVAFIVLRTPACRPKTRL